MRHLQRMELTAALDEYAASVPVDPPRLLIMRTATKKQWRYIGPPEILDVDRRGSDATVYTMLQSQTRAPNGRRDISRRPYAFHLRKEDGSWKLSDNLFLVVMAQAANAPLRAGSMRRAAGLLLCAVVLSGCGDEASETRYLNDPRVISTSQVESLPAGSPERAVIEWGRAVLFADAVTAARLYDPALHVTATKLPERLETVQSAVSAFRSVRVADVTRTSPRRASVVADVTGSTGDPDEEGHILLTFPMKRVDGEWKLAAVFPKVASG